MDPTRLPRIAYDPATLEEFYREHVGLVQRFVVRRVADPHLAADLTADVFLAAIEASPSYQPDRAAPAAWLYGVARNVVAAEHRRSVRERRARARIEGRRLLDESDVERMQERIDAAGRARELFEALAHVPERERAVLELVALDELTVTEAASALGVRPVTARVRLHRARTALRRHMTNHDSVPISQPQEAA
jgi:RNA polymerase sigma-70 factor (ECF subfamily)